MSKGGRNLIILGLAAVLITILTCAVSLQLYHSSGDIYLDRSRPGFLPEEDEEDYSVPENYKFAEEGAITNDDIDEYLKHIQEEIYRLDSVTEPFGEKSLSNSTLNIPE